MEYDESRQVVVFLSGLLLGAALGAAAALLMAPEPGRRTRKRIRRAAVDLRESTGDRLDDLADEVKGRVDEAIRGARNRLIV